MYKNDCKKQASMSCSVSDLQKPAGLMDYGDEYRQQ